MGLRFESQLLMCHLGPGPVEAHGARDDHLVGGEGGQEEIGGGGARLNAKGDSLEEVVNTQGQHDQEASGCRLQSQD